MDCDHLYSNKTPNSTRAHKFEANQAIRIPLAAQLSTVAKILSRGVSTGSNDFRAFTTAFPKVHSPCPPFTKAFLSAMIIVVIIPAMDIPTADRPTKFSFSHFLIFWSLVMSSSWLSLTFKFS